MSGRVFVTSSLALLAACAKTPAPAPVTTIVYEQRPPQVVVNPHVSHELLERCRRDARDWYKRVWEDAPKTPGVQDSSEYTYGARQGRCLIVVDSLWMSAGKATTARTATLTDLLENRELAAFKSDYNGRIECTVNGTPCTSRDEWDSLTKRYMEE